MRIVQTGTCSDFDVTPDGWASPAFRVLLPEWIRGGGVKFDGLCHLLPGRWTRSGEALEGRFTDGLQLDLSASIRPRGGGAVRVRLAVANRSAERLSALRANICTALNHLPGAPGWSNARFLGDLPPDRTLQGRHWYEKVAPRGLKALAGGRWHAMHPNPGAPDASRVPLYSFEPSEEDRAAGCAVEAPGGGLFFYQAWRAPCRWCAPCPGNACMHLEPFLAAELPPGGEAALEGEIGLHEGDWATQRRHLEEGLAGHVRN